MPLVTWPDAAEVRGAQMEFDESILIRRPARDVFALLVDVQKWAVAPGSPVAAMDKIPPGPTAVGTRWREVVKLGRWSTMTMWSEVTEIEPERMLAERFWGAGMHGTIVYTVTPEDGHAILRQRESLATGGWLRPFGWLVERMLRPRLVERLRDIKRELEEGGAPS